MTNDLQRHGQLCVVRNANLNPFLQIFDLKGSTRNRHVQSTGRENEVLLDENLVQCTLPSDCTFKILIPTPSRPSKPILRPRTRQAPISRSVF